MDRMLRSAPNFRDLGGLTASDGRAVRIGLLYRSEALLSPSPGDAALLRELRISTVVDLRRAMERELAPNAWWRGAKVDVLDVDLFAGHEDRISPWDILRSDPTPAGAHRQMLATYELLAEVSGRHIGVIAAHMADTEGGMLIHCTAGKDRTGFIVSMLLHAIGVSMDDIIVDYLQSRGRFNEEVLAATRALAEAKCGFRVSDQTIETLAQVNPEYLERAFSTLSSRFGSLDEYLRSGAGVNEELRSRLREKYLEFRF